ncbi:MAG: transcriptional regulator [Xanthomonadaceae bacterium]|nr:transcriptional regulator [Xanthomonadaceae bacterium]
MSAALFTPVQQRVLGLLFGQPHRQFQSAELIRLAGAGTGAVHRQLLRFAECGLLRVTTSGNQKYYQANPDSPIFTELTGLIRKTSGLAGPLRDALAPLAERIHTAFIYGSVAAGADRADSDIDLMVVADDVDYPTVIEALEEAERELGRRVSPRVMSVSDWQTKRKQPNSFAARIAERPQVYLVGRDGR